MKIPVKITQIKRLSPTVKAFSLDTRQHPFAFLPGQWIDCFIKINGKTEVAGYSITSSPTKQHQFSIAVKLVGDNPVTEYLHQQAATNHTLHVEGGKGDFHYTANDNRPITLIAGGIGITPIASIIRYIDETNPQIPTTLLYSASSPAELLFRAEFEDIANRNPHFRAHFTTTRPHNQPWRGATGRIDANALRNASAAPNSLYYLCGPPQMIQDIAAALKELRIPNKRVKFEQWW